MRYDFLREPISEDEPCGPDLEESFDQTYAQWTGEASGLVPERYYTPRMGGGVTVFDRATIDYPEQERRLTELLKRSKDIRVLVLDARFQLLEGDLVGFSEALSGVEILTTGFWDAFHPLPFDGTDYIMRVNTLEALNDNVLVTPALHRVPLVSGRSQITYRNFLVATGALTPYEGEEVMSRDSISRALMPAKESRDYERIREQLLLTRDTAVTCLATLGVIRQTFIDKAGHTNAPKFELRYPGVGGVEQVTGLDAILKAIVAFLNEHLGEEQAIVADGETAEDGAVSDTTARRPGEIATHAAAAAALKAAEDYFLRREPSSPVLILAHQARLLIGRPLVEALETLLPEPAARASLRFESGFPFSIDLSRMKLVTDNVMASVQPAESESWSSEATDSSSSESSDSSWSTSSWEESASSEEASSSEDATSEEAASAGDESEVPAESETPADETPAEDAVSAAVPASAPPVDPSVARTFVAETRLEASYLLSAVETFFRQVEPSSPIPTLLVRARSYFGKDFSAILNEMMPPEPGYGSE